MENKISVIIPTFNGERYLQRTIDSIMLHNNINNFELIIVNDGSTDNTINILHKNAQKFKNIIVIDKENSGVSDSRNCGLLKAKNSLIMFCDDDDEYEKNVIDKVLIEFNKKDYLDLLVFGRYDINGNSVRFCNDHHEIKEHDVDSFIIKRFCTGITTFSVCNKVYKTSILKKEKIQFNSELKFSEDLDFNLNYMKNICKIEENYSINYIRYCNEGSTLYKKNENFFGSNIILLEKLEENYKNFYSENVFISLYNHYILVCLNRLFSGIDDNNNSYKDFKHECIRINQYLQKKKIHFVYPKSIRNNLLFGLFNIKMYFILYLVSVQIGNIIRKCRE